MIHQLWRRIIDSIIVPGYPEDMDYYGKLDNMDGLYDHAHASCAECVEDCCGDDE